jgi:hypothetical protein
MERWLKRWGWAVLLLAAGAALRVAFMRSRVELSGDALMYGDLARNMLLHHVYGLTESWGIRPTLIRLPGYPAFLAACFAVFGVGNYVAAMWVQVVADLVACGLLGGLAARLWGRRVGLVALGLGMLCPFTANYCATPLTETLVIFCVALTLFAMERWTAGARAGRVWNWWMAVVGLALVYGIFLRPDQGLLAVVIVAAMVWVGWRESRGRGILPVGVMCVAMAMPFLLWGVRNWRVFHVVQPLAPRYAIDPSEWNPYGFQRWYRTWAVDFNATMNVYWNYGAAPMAMGDLPKRAIDNPMQRAETERLYVEYNQTETPTRANDAGFAKLAEERIAARPLRYYVWVPALKVADMWLRPRTALLELPLDWWRFREHERGSWECLGLVVWNAAYLVLAGLGVWKWRRGDRALAWAMIAYVVLRCLLLWTIDNSEPRYTLECFPMLILWGAYAVGRWLDSDAAKIPSGAKAP